MATVSPGRSVVQCVRDLRARGPEALSTVPGAEQRAALDAAERERRLADLRVELYALTALVADGVVDRALAERAAYPPYGLARSKFSDLGMVSINPDPYEEGSLATFHALWNALVDTAVLALHRELGARRHTEQAWTIEALERRLPVFAAVERADKGARKRDLTTFVYGGLQFGASVCVQLTEVGARVLRRDEPGLSADEVAAVLTRSTGPAHRLAALDLDRALAVYRRLLSSAADTPEQGRDKPGWLDAGRFSVRTADGQAWQVALHGVDAPAEDAVPDGAVDARLGCPARIDVDGEATPIGALWRWTVELALESGLLAAPR